MFKTCHTSDIALPAVNKKNIAAACGGYGIPCSGSASVKRVRGGKDRSAVDDDAVQARRTSWSSIAAINIAAHGTALDEYRIMAGRTGGLNPAPVQILAHLAPSGHHQRIEIRLTALRAAGNVSTMYISLHDGAAPDDDGIVTDHGCYGAHGRKSAADVAAYRSIDHTYRIAAGRGSHGVALYGSSKEISGNAATNSHAVAVGRSRRRSCCTPRPLLLLPERLR